VAIVGLGARFPRSPSPDRFWSLVASGQCAAREVPPGRWALDPLDAYDPRVPRPDHVYSTRACFVEEEISLDAAGLDVDLALLDRLDPLFRLALAAGVDAWRSARTEGVDRSRVGVVFGNIVLPTSTVSEQASEPLLKAFAGRVGWAELDRAASRSEPLNTRVAGLPAGLLSQALGLGGGAWTLDAACASSLYALKQAVDELVEGRADAMIAGGVSRPDSLYTQMGFAQLRALSPSGVPSPFGARADGLVVGEGAGLFVLKRLSDAVRQGDRILGVIAGVGLSNDVGGGLLAPSSEGQLRALRQAYAAAGWKPDDVDLIECHATGTLVGDAVEVQSLRELWGPAEWRPAQCVIGSVKSNVGHALTAAGAAGLLKVLLALEHEHLPPTAGFTQPAAGLELASSPFRILGRGEPWPRRGEGVPRRAALSGFGFGGINAHVLIEEWLPGTESATISPNEPKPIAIVGLAARFGPDPDTRAFAERILGADADSLEDAPPPSWGVDDPAVPERHGIRQVGLDPARFRIPPRELEEMLPQQALVLSLAAEVAHERGWDDGVRLRTGAIVGLGLDLNATHFHARWVLPDRAREWAGDLGLSDEERDAWVGRLRDAMGPALNANRTMGALGSIVASRVAREFRLGGPSFTVSSEETSALRALEVARRMLARGELDEALVGAVDLPCDIRSALAEVALHPGEPLVDGAVVLALKRLEDAERDGDHVLAVIRNSGFVVGPLDQAVTQSGVDRANLSYCDAPGLPVASHAALASSRARLGNAGAATGLLALAQATLALDRRILPAWRGGTIPEGVLAPRAPRFWLRDRVEGPRRAGVGCSGVDGSSAFVVLEEAPVRGGLVPVEPRPAALFVVEGDAPGDLIAGLEELESLAVSVSRLSIESLARLWLRRRPLEPRHRLAVAIVAEDVTGLGERILVARGCVASDNSPAGGSGVAYAPRPLGPGSGLAFVFPGMGNHFAGMGRELATAWPEVLERQDRENLRLRSQLEVGLFWNADPPATFADHRGPIFGQVTLGALVSDLLTSFGVRPSAAVGYSLGETTALFALRPWTDRDAMFDRFTASPLFQTDLCGPCDAARKAWALSEGEAVDWVAGIVARGADEVRAIGHDIPRAYVLIANTDQQCVIGGQGAAIRALVERLGVRFHPLPLVSTVHCAIVREVETAYRELHLLPTSAPAGIRYYGGATGEPYAVSRESAADSILAHALHGVDFPSVIRRAYADGVRAFVEVGPGSSCTRMIRAILHDQPHVAVAACPSPRSPVRTLLEAVATLVSERFPVDLDAILGPEPAALETPSSGLMIPVGGPPFDPPPMPMPHPSKGALVNGNGTHQEAPPAFSFASSSPSADSLTAQVFATEAARGGAHSAFLQSSNRLAELMGRQVAFEMALIERLAGSSLASQPVALAVAGPPRALGREQCLEFAVGSIGRVLGPDFAAIDAFPTRVRLPDEPLMLVDRILAIEGEPRSMTSGRVVTEHDVLPGAWYLDGGRIPTCVAVEAGQADLFLSAFLGIDFETEGLAVYRLLDASVTFHRSLPGPGEVIHYDIAIDQFFRQGDSRLFRFRFEATVAGEPLMSMRDGCAGFFTAEALAAGQGIVQTALDRRPLPGLRPDDWLELVPMTPQSLDDAQVEALRRGDLAGAFGPEFSGLPLEQPLPLPGGLMRLVDRVLAIEPGGGRYGLGLIRAEADIDPTAWFMTCHFVDDRVMPGTLMFECCLHTLRIFLSRIGWVGEASQVACEPVPGVSSRLKCRGQVVESTRKVTYEVTIKELGYRPEPYAIVDALMYADGRAIVEIGDMSLRMTGLDRGTLERTWAGRQPAGVPYPYEKILAFAVGKPSEAFGDRYRPFDADRVIARLPGPPYQFLDRVVEVQGAPWVMVAGPRAVAEYDVPPDAWYFAADRQPRMPFAVLLETALQPCGWLAAYVGSALTSDVDLSFRNLGGSAVQHEVVDASTGTLRTEVTLTKVSSSGGMIIQQYDFAMTAQGRPVYQGETTFGFFSKAALANQVGIRDAALYEPTPLERARAVAFPFPRQSPFPDERWGMIDDVMEYVPDGGPRGLGFARGTLRVDPSAWFFAAHFFQDPVVPGSLGLESLLQLLKVVVAERWGVEGGTVFESIGLGDTHRWTYRGQVLPNDTLVTVRATITAVDDASRKLTADGFLDVDGRVIYQMNDFTLRVGR
jgi:acyl transferase domain-containing protein/3-hydroxymyristoyl/3-hydroxydecanoyl-(acyl carrier protein) dehydratase